MTENALIGGEESGGYGFRGHVPERDGILAGLYFLDYLTRQAKRPHSSTDLYKKVGPHYYDRLDIHTCEERKKQMLSRYIFRQHRDHGGQKVVKLDTRDGFRYKLENGSWLLMRFSGTEPLVRSMLKAAAPKKCRNDCNTARNWWEYEIC